MLSELLVGPAANSPANARLPQRAGQLGDAIFSELHGRFYEQAYRGNLFGHGHSGPVALSANTITLTATTTPILGVWNPLGSGKNLVMLQAALNLYPNTLTTPVAPGALVWASSLNNGGISTGALPVNKSTMLASGAVARGFAGNVALTGLSSNLAIFEAADFPIPLPTTYGTLAGTAVYPSFAARADIDGAIIVPQGGVLALLNTTSTTTFSAHGRLLWEEVPV